ncbi:LuxR C-terminal-related transcriptional regulator [Paenarthrobacter nitroguajacolicus]|uniref:LuxR C-terminal-related transcriptional regulator n=1 Tax=Paenarthrobacter nitroguajacolicus TaxID=211146 RepID=UPI003AE35D18
MSAQPLRKPETSAQATLTEAREAFTRGDWDTACRTMERVGEESPLSLEDLEILARSKWWLGDVQGSMALSEEVFHRLVADEQFRAAAKSALTLSLQWGVRGNIAVSSAWMNRARRLLDGLPEAPEHGYLLYLEGNDAIYLEGDADSAYDAALQLRAMNRRQKAPELESFAFMLSGLAAVRRGETTRGFADLDQALLPVMAGQVSAEWGGDIYCSVIHLCYELADYSRMRWWTDALAAWCAGLSTSFMYSGIVRVHELQLISAEGGWKQAEEELSHLGERLRNAHAWIAADCFCELGDIRRRQGNRSGAAAAYAMATALGTDAQPGSALLLADAGKNEEALTDLRAALADRGLLGRAWLLLPIVELLAPMDTDSAEVYCSELEGTAAYYGTVGLLSWAHHARGTLLMAHGLWLQSLREFEAAAQGYRSQHLRYELARIHERMSSIRAALGETAAADAERATAAAIRARLGAAPLSLGTADHEREGLTAREIEVLGCVLSGSSNRQIAHTLTISEKTAGRHLANIFTKIGVSSRTAAAAWARHHGISEDPRA